MKNEFVLSLDAYLTGDCVFTPRGCFSVANVSRSRAESMGYFYHHISDDYNYIIVSNGIIAYAIFA